MSDGDRRATRWRCICAYDGGRFDGWQSQPGGNAIQDVIERRLRGILGRDIRIHGSGRTDAGVHALGQVFHFNAFWTHGPQKLRAALRAGLPREIQVRSVRTSSPDFHARFSATGKIYRYNLNRGEADPFTAPWCWEVSPDLDLGKMKSAADIFRGRHDFRAFSAEGGTPRESTVRELRRLEISAHGKAIRLVFEADGFLYKMVRSLTGALVAAGNGRMAPGDIAALLRSARRTPQVHTAPPQGLFLVKVLY